MSKFRIALAQINVTVGDLAGNKSKIVEYMSNARDIGADVVVFPELSVTGYPPEDLVLRPQFVEDNLLSLNEIAGESKGISSVIGFVDRDSALRNSAAVDRSTINLACPTMAFLTKSVILNPVEKVQFI